MQIRETRIVILISIKAVTKEIRVEKWQLVPSEHSKTCHKASN
jgi:hypothetical protein